MIETRVALRWAAVVAFFLWLYRGFSGHWSWIIGGFVIAFLAAAKATSRIIIREVKAKGALNENLALARRVNRQLPLPGTFGVTKIGGWTGFVVGLGEYVFNGNSTWTHAFIVLDEDTIIQGMPGGAEVVPLSTYDEKDVVYNIRQPLTPEQRTAIVAEARKLVGTPYNWLDYFGLLLARFGLRPQWLARLVNRSKDLICSQLVDLAYSRGGVDLFNDERLPGDVTPGDLADLITRDEW